MSNICCIVELKKPKVSIIILFIAVQCYSTCHRLFIEFELTITVTSDAIDVNQDVTADCLSLSAGDSVCG